MAERSWPRRCRAGNNGSSTTAEAAAGGSTGADGSDEAVRRAAGIVHRRGTSARQRLQAFDAVGDNDGLSGFDRVAEVSEQFVGEIFVGSRDRHLDVMGIDQAVIGDLELARENLAGAHLRQVDRGWLDHDDRHGDVGLVRGRQHHIVAVLEGNGDHLPGECDRIVGERNLARVDDARLDRDAADIGFVPVPIDAQLVPAGGKIVEGGLATGVGRRTLGDGRHTGGGFFLQHNRGAGQTVEGSVRRTIGERQLEIGIDDLEQRAALASRRNGDGDGEVLGRTIASLHMEVEMVDHVDELTVGRRGGRDDHALLRADVDRAERGGGLQADPGGQSRGVRRDEAKRGILQRRQSEIFEHHRLGGHLSWLHADFSEVGRGLEIGLGRGKRVVHRQVGPGELAAGAVVAHNVEV